MAVPNTTHRQGIPRTIGSPKAVRVSRHVERATTTGSPGGAVLRRVAALRALAELDLVQPAVGIAAADQLVVGAGVDDRPPRA